MSALHDCSRIGCTRLTAEQECDLHAAEPAGVVHPAKEPRRTVRASKARMRYGDFLRAKDVFPDMTFRDFIARGFVLRHPNDCMTTIPRGDE